MGNRCVQYFLRWALQLYGQDWIDENVHAFLALGPPFIGAPKCVRGIEMIKKTKLFIDLFFFLYFLFFNWFFLLFKLILKINNLFNNSGDLWRYNGFGSLFNRR